MSIWVSFISHHDRTCVMSNRESGWHIYRWSTRWEYRPMSERRETDRKRHFSFWIPPNFFFLSIDVKALAPFSYSAYSFLSEDKFVHPPMGQTNARRFVYKCPTGDKLKQQKNRGLSVIGGRALCACNMRLNKVRIYGGHSISPCRHENTVIAGFHRFYRQ